MKRILVIDDEANIRDTISMLLTSRGFDVVTAGDGLAGVKAARTHRPDLVISDINMEPVDGFMTLSIIKQLPATGCIPFIMVTGNRELDTMRKGLILGADDYLTKPFTPDELLETVNTQLKRREVEIAGAVEQVAALKAQLSGRSDGTLEKALWEIREAGEQIARSEGSPATVCELGARIAERVAALRREIVHAALLVQIETVAANPDALNVLRHAALGDFMEVVESECRQQAESFSRLEDLQLHLGRCQVAVGSAALSRISEELANNAFAHSPPGSAVTVKCRIADQSVQLSFENKIQRRVPRGVSGEAEAEAKDAGPDFEAGQGLRFVRRLVQIHGGNFSVTPRAQNVVAVHLELPLLQR